MAVCAIIVTILCHSAPLFAAEPTAVTSETLAELTLDQLSEIKVETVYGASRREQKTTEAPSSVSIVTHTEIQQNGHRTLGEILSSISGLYTTYDRGYNYIGIRGFSRPGDFGGRLLLMIDGHRMNDGVYDTAATGMDFPLDVDMIERVEVIRGPGSSLYGNNAFFGVVNVITRRGAEVNGGEISGSYGSYDTWTGRVTYGQRFTNQLEFVVSASIYDSAGQESLNFPEFVAHDLDGEYTPKVFASARYKDFLLQGGYSRREKDWPTAAYDTIPNSHDPSLTSRDDRAWVDLKFERELESEWLVSARSYFDRYLYEGQYPFDYDANPATPADVNMDSVIATSAGLELAAGKTLFEVHQVSFGGEWRHDFELDQENWDVGAPAPYLDSHEKQDILGLYVQDEWRVRQDLILNAGIRYDHYTAFGGTVNPRAALIYTPWESSTFKFVYGTAFRAPNAYELFYASTDSRANPGLDPETIRSYEIIWEQRYHEHLRSSVSLFWNDVEDLINQKFDPIAGKFYFDNTFSTVARGIECEAEARLQHGIRILANYTFADARNTDTDRQLENSPRHIGKLNLSAPVWSDRLIATLEVEANDSRKTLAGGDAAGYFLLNFTLFSREIVKGLEFSASVYNLLNERYSHPVSADFSYTGPISGNSIQLDTVEQDGRTFRVKITYHF